MPRLHVGVRQGRDEPVRVDDLAEGVQDAAVVEVEHVAADNGRLAAVVGEGQEPHDAFGLDDDVVVEQQDVVAAVFDGLEHAAGEAAGAAQVRLVDDPQLAAEGVADFREALLVLDLLRALVHDQDFLDVFKDVRVVRQDAGRCSGRSRACSWW